jgi:protein TonB
VVERLVSDNPMFIPPDVETTPRLRAIFAAARSKLVPGLAKRSYAEAKVAFESRNHEEAQAGFKRTVDLIDTLSENERAPLSDLRLLAGEFLKLSVPLPAPAGPSEPTKPLLDNAPTRTAGAFIGPIPMREQLPAWVPPDGPARRTEYSGLLRVEIDADGRVTSATIVKASHPAYDAAAVTAARQWVYRPATRGGQPVPSSKEISLRLVPQ